MLGFLLVHSLVLVKLILQWAIQLENMLRGYLDMKSEQHTMALMPSLP